jgi:multidrug efflux pump subunit AcrA (membrane-fusion protein)
MVRMYYIKLFFLFFLFLQQGLQAQQTYENYVVQARPILSYITLGGTVVPSKEVTLSAQLPGRIKTIAGEEGDEFKENIELVKIADDELTAKRRAAMAEMLNTEAILRNAGIQYSKELLSPDSKSKAPGGMGIPYMFDNLFTEPATDMMMRSDSVLDRRANLFSYSTKIEQARSSLVRARSQIDIIDTKLRDAKSLAPFAGVIVKKFIEIGDTVQPGMPLLKFANIQDLQIRVDVPARLVPSLKVGMMVTAKLDIGGRGQVKVARIFPVADPEKHTVTVKFDLPSGIKTGPGQYAEIELQDHNTMVKYLPVIPQNAIVRRGSLPSVYIIKNNKRELRIVRTGNIYGNEIVVLSGLKPGETIEVNTSSNSFEQHINNTPLLNSNH